LPPALIEPDAITEFFCITSDRAADHAWRADDAGARAFIYGVVATLPEALLSATSAKNGNYQKEDIKCKFHFHQSLLNIYGYKFCCVDLLNRMENKQSKNI
jgi:hypothetical protein